MKKIILLCSAGMSTSILVKKMREEAEKINFACTIDAHSVNDAYDQAKDADVVLLGPQIRYELKRITDLVKPVPVASIEMLAYGMMDGKKVLQQALELMEK